VKSNPSLDSRRIKAGALVLVGAGLLILGIVAGILLIQNRPGPGRVELPPAEPAVANFSAPDLNLHSLDGSLVSLADYRGQVVLVNNWATWCPPCQAEMPTLQAYYEAHKDQGFVLVAIEGGEPASEVAHLSMNTA
jgi:thiol-disulfide isomerase/thioredoxin